MTKSRSKRSKQAKNLPNRRDTVGYPSADSVDISIGDAVQLGIGLHQQGRVAEAIEIYQQILAAVPNQGDALHFLGVAEHQSGRSQKALDLIERAASLLPDLPDVHNNLGNVLKQLGRVEEAEAAYRKALALNPEDPSALNNLGTILREQGAYIEAEASFRRVIALRPDHYGAHQNLGNTLAHQHRFGEALEEYRSALRLQPSSGDAYRHVGAMFYALGRVGDAEAIYREWHARDPKHPIPLHLIAACSGKAVPERAPDAFVRVAFDEFAATFDSTLAHLQYRAPELLGETVVGAIGDQGRVSTLLDAGCGTGLCAPWLRNHTERLIGVDLSGKMLARAAERQLYDELIEGELTEALRSRPNSCDVIVSADTLVYFGSLEAVFQAAAGALRPRGHLLFTVERLEGDEAADFRIHPHGRYSHNESYLRRLLAQMGFQIEILRAVELRREAGKWVNGWLVAARLSP